ncbi:hypothetical protein [Viridibacillus arvi]|uniref:hypothetical protein n=1 Tax=Viridibacillus arvi TaxID=263475 RepID=UPI0034CED3A0
MFVYDEEHNQLTIEWRDKEKQRKEPYYFSKRPIYCQIHPRFSDKVMRAYFKGAMPSWIGKFAKSCNYNAKEVSGVKGKGFWISNLLGDDGLILCPTTSGAIDEWFERVPEEFENEKSLLMQYMDIVDVNLKYYSKDYEQFGIFYRRESVIKEKGMLCLQANLFPSKDEDNEPINEIFWDKFPEVIKKLIEPHEIPDEALEPCVVEEEEFEIELNKQVEEISFTADYMDENQIEDLVNNDIELSSQVIEDIQEIEVVSNSTIEVIEKNLPIIEDLEEVEVMGELVEPNLDEITVSEFEIIDDIEPTVESITDEDMVISEKTDLIKVAKRSSKKEGIIEGQFLLF